MTIANRSRLEQETIINFNEEEKVASVYTFNKPLQKRLAKLAEQYPDDCKREFDTWQPEGSVDYTVPKKKSGLRLIRPKRLTLRMNRKLHLQKDLQTTEEYSL